MSRQEIRVPTLVEPISQYTDAVRAGNLLFISGCAPVDADANLVGGSDVALQARQVFSNMKEVLDFVGLGFGDIVKVTVLLTDTSEHPRVTAVRREFFGESRPASTLMGVQSLALPEMKVEVEAIAVFPEP